MATQRCELADTSGTSSRHIDGSQYIAEYETPQSPMGIPATGMYMTMPRSTLFAHSSSVANHSRANALGLDMPEPSDTTDDMQTGETLATSATSTMGSGSTSAWYEHAVPAEAIVHIPRLPAVRTHPDDIHPGIRCTLYVASIAFCASERDLVEHFNSVNGVFDRKCTALSAVHIMYIENHVGYPVIKGQGFFTYSTPELASFALRSLDRRTFSGCPLFKEMAKRNLVRRPSDGSNIR